MTASFSHFDLDILNPSFDSPLVDTLTELEYVRRRHHAHSSVLSAEKDFPHLRELGLGSY